jgi:hypothetical protein
MPRLRHLTRLTPHLTDERCRIIAESNSIELISIGNPATKLTVEQARILASTTSIKSIDIHAATIDTEAEALLRESGLLIEEEVALLALPPT